MTAFAGLNPTIQQSGDWAGCSSLSRTSSARLRAGLLMAGRVAIRYNAVVKALAERLASLGKAYKQIVCAAMGRLLCLAYGVI